MNSKSVFSLLLVDFFLILLGNNIVLDGTSFFKSLFIMLIGSGLPVDELHQSLVLLLGIQVYHLRITWSLFI